MDGHLAYFLDLRLRLRGRPEAIALVDRCIRMIARSGSATEVERRALDAELAGLRAELVARFGARPAVRIH